jgi:hypothetical protein
MLAFVAMLGLAIVLNLLATPAQSAQPMKSIKEAVTNFPGSHLDADGFVAQRCSALYTTIAGGFADSNPAQKPWFDRGTYFFGLAIHIQKKIDPAHTDPHEMRDAIKPMVEAYVPRANEQRARTGNYMDDPVIKADYQLCQELLRE